jgi:hypothetical protein
MLMARVFASCSAVLDHAVFIFLFILSVNISAVGWQEEI